MIVDTPIFSSLQRLYLDSLLGMNDGEWLIEAAEACGARRQPIGGFMPNQDYVLR